MARRSVVRTFFEVSGLGNDYAMSARRIILPCLARDASNDNVSEAVVEKFSARYVTFMANIFAKHYSDEEVAELTMLFRQAPVLRKLIAIELQYGDAIERFLLDQGKRLFGTQFETMDDTIAFSSERPLPH